MWHYDVVREHALEDVSPDAILAEARPHFVSAIERRARMSAETASLRDWQAHWLLAKLGLVGFVP